MKIDYKEMRDHAEILEVTYKQNPDLKKFNWYLGFYPNFFDLFCKIQECFNGSPIIPRLYTNAMHKNYFVRNLNRGIIIIAVIQLILGTVCVMAYGNRLQEIVLMNLHYGVFSNFIKLLYAIGMVVNLVLQIYPILEIIETR